MHHTRYPDAYLYLLCTHARNYAQQVTLTHLMYTLPPLAALVQVFTLCCICDTPRIFDVLDSVVVYTPSHISLYT